MPILPHGSGAYYNIYGEAITYGGIIREGQPIGYGEYMSYRGQIIGAGVNFYADGTSYNIYAINYSTSQFQLIGSTDGLLGSISYNTVGGGGTVAGAGVLPALPYNTVLFSPGDYIGIYIDGPSSIDSSTGVETLKFGLEGTLYLRLTP